MFLKYINPRLMFDQLDICKLKQHNAIMETVVFMCLIWPTTQFSKTVIKEHQYTYYPSSHNALRVKYIQICELFTLLA